MTLETSRAWAEINLSRIENNMRLIKSHLNPDVKAVAVIKANAYGHGAADVAKLALKNGFDYLAVACLSEAMALRKEGIAAPILLLSGVNTFLTEEYINNGIIPAVSDIKTAKELNLGGREIKIHLKIDTGMTRLGFDSYNNIDKTISDIKEISLMENIQIDGIFSHFAVSDDLDENEYTSLQFERFANLTNKLKESGIDIGLRHICNSAATLLNKDMHLDMVRCGLILYGYYPDARIEKIFPGLKPAFSLKARISQIREIYSGTTVSYGRSYRADSTRKVAVIPIGYADGYSRLLSNRFYVLINGQKAPIVGRVCMDQLMADITDINGVCTDSVVTLIGEDSGAEITVEDMADTLNTISYEITCDFSERIPRISYYDKI